MASVELLPPVAPTSSSVGTIACAKARNDSKIIRPSGCTPGANNCENVCEDTQCKLAVYRQYMDRSSALNAVCSSGASLCDVSVAGRCTRHLCTMEALESDMSVACAALNSTAVGSELVRAQVVSSNLRNALNQCSAGSVVCTPSISVYAKQSLTICFDGSCQDGPAKCPTPELCPVCPARREACAGSLPIRCRDGECRARSY